jgi:glycosyltransferase involved in cell wall biosynthesis
MRVLQIISSTGFYGAESMMASLSSALVVRGCQVDTGVLDLNRMSATDQAVLCERCVGTVHDFRYRGLIDLGAIRRLTKFIRSQAIDIVHCHGYKADILGLLAARATDRKVIATCHNWTRATASLTRYSQLDLKVLRYFDCVVAVSDAVSAQLLRARVPRVKVHRIDNGIDVAAYSNELSSPTASTHFVLGVVSRLSTEKGLDVLLRALPQVFAIYPSLICRIVGQGPQHSALLDLAREMQIESHIHFEGFHSDIKTFLSECTLIALPSRTEGTPLAILEAMAARRPVIASAVGNVPHILLGGAAGVLVPPENPDDLARGIIALLSDANLRDRLAARAHEHVVSNFDQESMAARYLDIYNDVCAAFPIAMTRQYQ